ncbi:MAG: phosphoribosylglycinamide formyltransferase [Clostridiales bacterium]|nr:phosphoribosylglycinamide formyltransferase [Clostridiales bacterium]
MKNIAVLVSGGGTNLQALIDATVAGKIRNGRISIVLSSRRDAYALERARAACIDCCVLEPKDYSGRDNYSKALAQRLLEHKIDLVVLAGFMHILSSEFIKHFENRIINVHPSLIPSFCGDGFYGLRVHEAVLEKGVKLTGATVHFVNEITDGGPIILQKAVPVFADDTAKTLQERVMREAEWQILPEAVSLFCEGRLLVEGGRVIISDAQPGSFGH